MLILSNIFVRHPWLSEKIFTEISKMSGHEIYHTEQGVATTCAPITSATYSFTCIAMLWLLVVKQILLLYHFRVSLYQQWQKTLMMYFMPNMYQAKNTCRQKQK